MGKMIVAPGIAKKVQKNATDISTLNSNISGVSSANLTAGAKFSVSNVVLYKLGHLCVVSYAAQSSSAYNMDDVIATLPTGYRPKENMASLLITLIRGTSSITYTGLARIKANGEMTQAITNSGQANDSLIIVGIYNTI